MRLTERKVCFPRCDNQGNLTKVDYIKIEDKKLAEEKLCQLEDIEEELGIDLIALFSQKYEESYDLEVEKDEKTIYFCGDSYYGHWTKEEWLDFIKEIISAYRELVKLGR